MEGGEDQYECEYCDRRFDAEGSAEHHEEECATQLAKLSGDPKEVPAPCCRIRVPANRPALKPSIRTVSAGDQCA